LNSISSLFLLECKLSRGVGSKKKRILTNVLTCVGTVLFVSIFTIMLCVSMQLVGDSVNIFGNLSLLLLVVQIILLLYSLSDQQKTIFLYKDKLTLSYLPVSKWHIFMAKSLKCLLDLYVVSTLITLPMLLIFGFYFYLPSMFYLLSIFAVIVMPLLPFAIANLLLIPVMMIHNFLKNKGVLKLILSIIATVIIFYIYIEIVFNIANLIFLNTTSENMLVKLTDFCSSEWLPSSWISGYLLNQSGVNFAMILIISVLFLAISLTIGSLTHKKIFNRSLVERTVAKVIPTSNNPRKAFWAYFITEIKDIFRNSSYSYTYFGMAIAMPLMVWSCGKFMLDFAIERIGENIVFGTTLLVVLIFVSIICSPTAAFISKEGDSFWILKTNPRGVKFPLFAKSLVGIMSSATALIVTLIILVAAGMIDILLAILVFAIAAIYIVCLVGLGLVLNLYRPNIFYSNKENNSNTFTHMIIGFIISIAVGVLAIFTSFNFTSIVVALIALGIIAVLTTVVLVILFTQNKKLYAKMEV